jgi:hypothetical protein
MKNALHILGLAFLIASVSSQALAEGSYGLELGVRQQSGDVDSGNATKSQVGTQLGAIAHFPVSDSFSIRTGMLYTQRSITDLGIPNNRLSLNYLDVPLAVMIKFEEYAGAFVGTSIALNLDKTADVGTLKNVKSPLTPAVFGVNFKFAPNLGATLYYENASGEAATGLKDFRAVGANLMITFD